MARTKFHATSVELWIVSAARELGSNGIALPRAEAERLAAFGLHKTWSQTQLALTTRLDDRVIRELDDLLARRIAGEPLAYIEGSRGFYGLELVCGPGVLVPRPDTETLVDVALELIDGRTSPIVVDIGTGTGAVALAIGSQRPDAEIVATDVSADALAYARRNIDAHACDVWLAHGDLFDAVPSDLRGRVDLVVSNPPYVREDAELPADVLAEPAIALRAGVDGEDVLRRIVADAPAWLCDGGTIALEIGDASQARVLEGATVRNDLAGRARVVWRRF